MTKAQAEEIVSKGEFAKLCGVTAGRLSQWIADEKISLAAFVGEGRLAKIRVLQAQADLKRSLDPNQMTANGIRTRIPGGPLQPESLSPPPPPRSPRRAADALASDSHGDEEETAGLDLPTERALLTREQRLNWQLRNAERRGELIDATEAERRWAEAIVDLRSRMLAVAGDLPALLPNLTPHDLEIIDRAYRDAMDRAAGGGA